MSIHEFLIQEIFNSLHASVYWCLNFSIYIFHLFTFSFYMLIQNILTKNYSF